MLQGYWLHVQRPTPAWTNTEKRKLLELAEQRGKNKVGCSPVVSFLSDGNLAKVPRPSTPSLLAVLWQSLHHLFCMLDNKQPADFGQFLHPCFETCLRIL